MQTSLYQVALAGSHAESVLYGVCLLLFPITLLVFRHNLAHIPVHSRKPQHILVAGTYLLFILITIHWIFDVIKISTSDQHFLNWTSVVTPAILEFEFLVVDALLIYRVYIVWGRSMAVIVLPMLCIIVSAISVVGLSISIAQMVPHSPYTRATMTWSILIFAAGLCTNIQAVGLIAYRVRKLIKDASMFNPMSLLLIIIESAAILGLINMICVIAILTDAQDLLSITIQVASPISGICLCMITLRVSLAKHFPALRDGSNDSVRRTTTSIIPMHLHRRTLDAQ